MCCQLLRGVLRFNLKRATLSLFASFLLLGAGQATSTAFAAPESRLASGLVQHQGENGRVYGWASAEYLAANPDAIPGVHAVKTGDGAIKPMSASGCNVNVCISVSGTREYVSNWTTTAYGNEGCIRAYFMDWAGEHPGPVICPNGTGPGVYYDTTGPTGLYHNGEQLCNFWERMSGLPCITIHT
jgi:hypothetical protein